MKQLKELLDLAREMNIPVKDLKDLIWLIQEANPDFLQKKREMEIRRWGILIGGVLSILALGGAVALALLASPSAAVSATVLIALIFASFIFAGGTFALASMQPVSVKDFSAMVSEIVAHMKYQDRPPVDIPLDLKQPQLPLDLKQPQQEAIELDTLYEKD